MGIPRYFRFLLESHGSTIYSTENPSCDHLFLDFNCIIYYCYYKTKDVNKLIPTILEEIDIIYNIVRPKKQMYIAIDGVVPRSKIHQQRSRRYKATQLQTILDKQEEWNPSNNICPGTQFMDSLCKSIDTKLKSSSSKYKCKMILDDCSNFGEGEHKILPYLKRLHLETTEKSSNVIVFSPDNDLLSLLILTQKNNIYLMRYIDSQIERQCKLSEKNNKNFIFISMNVIKEKFIIQEKRNLSINNLDEINLIIDYNFLVSICGNDFIQALPYMRIKSGGLSRLLRIYSNILKELKEFLIHKETLKINKIFFVKILNAMSYTEKSDFFKLGELIRFQITNGKMETNANLSKKDNFKNNLEHLYLCNKEHPLFHDYINEFGKIDFMFQDKKLFRYQYYSYFLEETDKQKIEIMKRDMVIQYMKSLQYCLYYYNRECPSRSFYYPYRSAPLFSDILYHIQETINFQKDFDFNGQENDIVIETPFQQLCFILPPQNMHVLPSSFQTIFKKYSFNFVSTFRVDCLQGLKYIYSESHLPNFKNSKHMLMDIKKIEKDCLTKKEKERNCSMIKSI